MIGLRLSPERFGMQLGEVIEVARRVMKEDQIDFLDMSLWDVFKEPEEQEFKGKTLMSYFVELDRENVRLGVAGKIRNPEEAEAAIAGGVDWIMLGRAAILHHDFPNQYVDNPRFKPVDLPASREHLTKEGLSPAFLKYMSNWQGFVAD